LGGRVRVKFRTGRMPSIFTHSFSQEYILNPYHIQGIGNSTTNRQDSSLQLRGENSFKLLMAPWCAKGLWDRVPRSLMTVVSKLVQNVRKDLLERVKLIQKFKKMSAAEVL
jgi:hypothetical protein